MCQNFYSRFRLCLSVGAKPTKIAGWEWDKLWCFVLASSSVVHGLRSDERSRVLDSLERHKDPLSFIAPHKSHISIIFTRIKLSNKIITWLREKRSYFGEKHLTRNFYCFFAQKTDSFHRKLARFDWSLTEKDCWISKQNPKIAFLWKCFSKKISRAIPLVQTTDYAMSSRVHNQRVSYLCVVLNAAENFEWKQKQRALTSVFSDSSGSLSFRLNLTVPSAMSRNVAFLEIFKRNLGEIRELEIENNDKNLGENCF